MMTLSVAVGVMISHLVCQKNIYLFKEDEMLKMKCLSKHESNKRFNVRLDQEMES